MIKAIGIMSGTSLDGLDLVYLEFNPDALSDYHVGPCTCVPYPEALADVLAHAMTLSGLDLTILDHQLGKFIGEQAKIFMDAHSLTADIIASHGHTIFHDPSKGYTLQIGKGSVIAKETNTSCINDFRSNDIAYGGQGAPLVPIGDRLLYGQYAACINIGGISNISIKESGTAYDIGIANIALNFLANLEGVDYDKDGAIGRSGTVNQAMVADLNALPYHQLPPPKSLGREWFDIEVLPILKNYDIKNADKLASVYAHMAHQLGKKINQISGVSLLTGGGALNQYLVELIEQEAPGKIEVPDLQTVMYKEAIIFGLLGALRFWGQPNCLSSVTGATKDTIGGAIYLP